MQRLSWMAVAALVTLDASAGTAQTIAQRIARADGVVEVIYPSRSGVCGDGRGMIGHVFGQSILSSGNGMVSGHTVVSGRPCEPGPARVEVSVASGEVTRLRPFVGPLASLPDNSQTLNVSAAEASAWLGELVKTGSGRVAGDAMLPMLLADAAEPWSLLLGVARDGNRSRATRSTALDWLANGVNAKLGLIGDDDARSDDDEMRQQAVFVLSQRPKSESVPELIDLAKNGKTPAVRRSAIFWLGQTGDPRAADTYAQLLNIR